MHCIFSFGLSARRKARWLAALNSWDDKREEDGKGDWAQSSFQEVISRAL